jgi:hypothetical protein
LEIRARQHEKVNAISPLAISRILPVQKRSNGKGQIRFDIILKKEFLPDGILFLKVAGVYKMNNNTVMEFYRDGDFLFYRTNGQIWGGLSYIGNNTFTGVVNDTEARLELLPQGKATVTFQFIRRRKTEL